ncbi:MAG: zinc ribbon domain-containing protein [Desulfonauticus sp.]|nr:zinc ribbon domain-containing protein [Desulfonauticus sp.]
MPIYEFCCKKCGEEFEELVLKDDTSIVCPHCHSKEVEKLMSVCKFRTGGPIVLGSSSTNSSSKSSSSSCAGCSGGNCSSCGL